MDSRDTPRSPGGKLAEILSGRIEAILSRVDVSSAREISPFECFKLWAYMGELEWIMRRDLSSDERVKLNSVVHRFRGNISELVENQKGKHVSCLEEGLVIALSKIDAEHMKTRDHLARRGPGLKMTSYELNDGLLGLRDQVGYAELLFVATGVDLSPPTREKIRAEDMMLKNALPQIIMQFRQNEDDPTPFPSKFPDSFWWRRIDS